VLDEPTNALDPSGVVLPRELLLGAARSGAAALVSSHHLDEVARIADRLSVIRAGDESPLVGPLREILMVATGPVVMLAEELGRIEGIESAFLYG